MRLKLLLLFLAALALSAQKARPLDPVRDVSVGLRNGAVVVEAPAGAHLKAAFMAVKLEAGTPGRLEVGPLPAPNGQDELGDGIWHGPVVIPVKAAGTPPEVALRVTYQPCTEGDGAICYPPTDQVLTAKAADLAGTPAPAPLRTQLWSFLAIFAFGLATAFTPCVYPMITIIMAIIGAKGAGRGHGFLLSLMLVLGMAATYTTLGVLAASFGSAFGAFAQHPGFLISVSVLFGLFALSLFGVFEIRMPSAWQSRLQAGPRKGFLGAFFMGLVLGPISAPCVAPVVGTVLLDIATRGQVVLGALKLFTFALGMGVLFVVAGTFSASLPRSGDWLVGLKRAMGLVVLGFAVWNVRFISPEWLNEAMWAGVLLAGAGALDAFAPAQGLLPTLRKALGLMFLTASLLLGLRAAESGLGISILPWSRARAEAVQEPWRRAWIEQDYEQALARAKAERKVLVVDAWAEWCAACKELDEKTWPDPRISAWIAQHAIAVRLDTFKTRRDLEQPLRILAYPTVLVLDGNGTELGRRQGFQNPAEMLAFLEGH